MLTVADTAYAIAHIRHLESELPPEEQLFQNAYAGVFAAAGGHAREGTERFLSLLFFRDGIRLRTRHIDSVTLEAAAHGVGIFDKLRAWLGDAPPTDSWSPEPDRERFRAGLQGAATARASQRMHRENQRLARMLESAPARTPGASVERTT